MIDQAQRLVIFASASINLRKCGADRWSAIGVFRFGQQFHSTFAFGDGSVFLTEGGENLTKNRVPGGVIGTFTNQTFCHYASLLERFLRFGFVSQRLIE
ncbi:MAG: hypothetical protein Udaeo2_32520 [Candidatus Udaeobacter sp.]|nr:MAG: hypothetical protein Udaeo2_32520 [Candidatus Udaeobacter sp.]